MANPTSGSVDESDRATRLLEAQGRACELFDVIAVEVIQAGRTELEANDHAKQLAADLFGVDKHWHKRIIRSGPNTLFPYAENPPDRLITDDDIVFVDLGPVFQEWEADVGRTYVIGDDPVKLWLRDDLLPVWEAGRAFFESHPSITGHELYAHMQELAADAGWEFGGAIAGHLVGEFPHERIVGDKSTFYITAGNHTPMRGHDALGRRLHWILEVHLVDVERQIGGFFEQLLNLP
jgi:Xaa-Pro dipeptidase